MSSALDIVVDGIPLASSLCPSPVQGLTTPKKPTAVTTGLNTPPTPVIRLPQITTPPTPILKAKPNEVVAQKSQVKPSTPLAKTNESKLATHSSSKPVPLSAPKVSVSPLSSPKVSVSPLSSPKVSVSPLSSPKVSVSPLIPQNPSIKIMSKSSRQAPAHMKPQSPIAPKVVTKPPASPLPKLSIPAATLSTLPAKPLNLPRQTSSPGLPSVKSIKPQPSGVRQEQDLIKAPLVPAKKVKKIPKKTTGNLNKNLSAQHPQSTRNPNLNAATEIEKKKANPSAKSQISENVQEPANSKKTPSPSQSQSESSDSATETSSTSEEEDDEDMDEESEAEDSSSTRARPSLSDKSSSNIIVLPLKSVAKTQVASSSSQPTHQTTPPKPKPTPIISTPPKTIKSPQASKPINSPKPTHAETNVTTFTSTITNTTSTTLLASSPSALPLPLGISSVMQSSVPVPSSLSEFALPVASLSHSKPVAPDVHQHDIYDSDLSLPSSLNFPSSVSNVTPVFPPAADSTIASSSTVAQASPPSTNITSRIMTEGSIVELSSASLPEADCSRPTAQPEIPIQQEALAVTIDPSTTPQASLLRPVSPIVPLAPPSPSAPSSPIAPQSQTPAQLIDSAPSIRTNVIPVSVSGRNHLPVKSENTSVSSEEGVVTAGRNHLLVKSENTSVSSEEQVVTTEHNVGAPDADLTGASPSKSSETGTVSTTIEGPDDIVAAFKQRYRDKYKATDILEGITAFLASENPDAVGFSKRVATWAKSAAVASMETIYAHGDLISTRRPRKLKTVHNGDLVKNRKLREKEKEDADQRRASTDSGSPIKKGKKHPEGNDDEARTERSGESSTVKEGAHAKRKKASLEASADPASHKRSRHEGERGRKLKGRPSKSKTDGDAQERSSANGAASVGRAKKPVGGLKPGSTPNPKKRCREVDGLALDPHFMTALKDTPRLKGSIRTEKDEKDAKKGEEEGSEEAERAEAMEEDDAEDKRGRKPPKTGGPQPKGKRGYVYIPVDPKAPSTKLRDLHSAMSPTKRARLHQQLQQQQLQQQQLQQLAQQARGRKKGRELFAPLRVSARGGSSQSGPAPRTANAPHTRQHTSAILSKSSTPDFRAPTRSSLQVSLQSLPNFRRPPKKPKFGRIGRKISSFKLPLPELSQRRKGILKRWVYTFRVRCKRRARLEQKNKLRNQDKPTEATQSPVTSQASPEEELALKRARMELELEQVEQKIAIQTAEKHRLFLLLKQTLAADQIKRSAEQAKDYIRLAEERIKAAEGEGKKLGPPPERHSSIMTKGKTLVEPKGGKPEGQPRSFLLPPPGPRPSAPAVRLAPPPQKIVLGRSKNINIHTPTMMLSPVLAPPGSTKPATPLVPSPFPPSMARPRPKLNQSLPKLPLPPLPMQMALPHIHPSFPHQRLQQLQQYPTLHVPMQGPPSPKFQQQQQQQQIMQHQQLQQFQMQFPHLQMPHLPLSPAQLSSQHALFNFAPPPMFPRDAQWGWPRPDEPRFLGLDPRGGGDGSEALSQHKLYDDRMDRPPLPSESWAKAAGGDEPDDRPASELEPFMLSSGSMGALGTFPNRATIRPPRFPEQLARQDYRMRPSMGPGTGSVSPGGSLRAERIWW